MSSREERARRRSALREPASPLPPPPPPPSPPPPRATRRRTRALTPPRPRKPRCTRRVIQEQERSGGNKIARYDCMLGEGIPLDDVIFNKKSPYYLDLKGKHIIYTVSNNIPNDKDRVKVGKSTTGFDRLKSYTFAYGRSCDKNTCDEEDIKRTGGVNLLFLAIIPKKYMGEPPRPLVNIIETNLLAKLRSKTEQRDKIFKVPTRGGEIFESPEGRQHIVDAVKELMDDKEVSTTSKGKALNDYDGRFSQRARDSSCRLALRNIARYCDAPNIFRDYTDRLKEELFDDIANTLDLSQEQKDKMKKERRKIMTEMRQQQRRIDVDTLVEEQEDRRTTRSQARRRINTSPPPPTAFPGGRYISI